MDKRIALVTGASRGIGRAVAAALAANGCHVLINYRRRQPDAEATLALIQRAGGSGELCPFDVADVTACEQAVARLLQTHQRIDVLVNNAGIRHDSLAGLHDGRAMVSRSSPRTSAVSSTSPSPS